MKGSNNPVMTRFDFDVLEYVDVEVETPHESW